MDQKKKQLPGCCTKFDHIFGPKDSSGSAVFGSIFSPASSTVGGRDSGVQDARCKNHEMQGNESKGGESILRMKSTRGSKCKYQNETVEGSYYSSSIYYGGQENYSQRGRSSESHPPVFKKDEDDDGSGNSASRGNWWQGSLYY